METNNFYEEFTGQIKEVYESLNQYPSHGEISDQIQEQNNIQASKYEWLLEQLRLAKEYQKKIDSGEIITEGKAIEIISQNNMKGEKINWRNYWHSICLDGVFYSNELRAIAWWMDNKRIT